MRFLIASFYLSITVLAQASDFHERWIYYACNLAEDKNIAAFESVAIRGAKAGYNGIVLEDYKFGRLGDQNKHYFQNIDRFKKIAAVNHLQIIPCIFPIGYSSSLLSHDPNLAEGLPVRDASYVVENGLAHIVPDPAVKLPQGGFNDLSKWQFHDKTVVAADDGAVKVSNPNGTNARIAKTVTVQPFHQYDGKDRGLQRRAQGCRAWQGGT